jgi:hypothetical protein
MLRFCCLGALFACGHSGGSITDGSGTCVDVMEDDANCGSCGAACNGAQHCVAGACRDSSIQHVVLVVEENHTFDAYFGRYCQAPAGSNPTCTSGPSCCERAPDTEPRGASPIVLDDSSNFAEDRDHLQACEDGQLRHRRERRGHLRRNGAIVLEREQLRSRGFR